MAMITSTIVAAGAAAHRRAMGLPDEPRQAGGSPSPQPATPPRSETPPLDDEAALRQQREYSTWATAIFDIPAEPEKQPGFEGEGGRSGGGGATGEW